MKNILLLIHDDAGQEARLQAALDLVRALSGHLYCLDVIQMPALIGIDPMMGDPGIAFLADERVREAENRERIEKRLAVEGVAWNWRETTGFIGSELRTANDLADVIVLNSLSDANDLPGMMGTVADAVLQSSKLVLAVPEARRGIEVNGDVLIAWDGGQVAANAVRFATPLLAFASSVVIVQIGESKGLSAGEAASYLSRHGIHALIDRTPQTDQPVAERLSEICTQRKPGYCVMGAFGHSRLGEFLFGGVTRSMLAHCPVPLLIGH